MIQIEIVLFAVVSVLIIVNVIVWNWHKKIQAKTDEILNNNALKAAKLQLKKVELDEKVSNDKYKTNRAQLEFDLKNYAAKPSSDEQ